MTTIEDKRCLGCGAGLARDSLSCDYCGTTHVVTASGSLGCACSGCAAANAPSAKSCVQCRAPLGNTCVECKVFNPLGARFCQECRIEFRTYRDAEILAGNQRIRLEKVDGVLMNWLDSRWFKARDLRKTLKILEKTLVWVPRWTFSSRVSGNVQGQVSQTHYRTEVRPSFGVQIETDPFAHEDLGSDRFPKRSNQPRVESVPYLVWEHVNKDFDQSVSITRPASQAAAGFNAFLEGSPSEGRPLQRELGTEPFERVFEPDGEDREAFRSLRGRARKTLEHELLEKVERLDLRFHSPCLSLVFSPVWHVVYRYKRTHGEARIDATSGRVDGKRISLLSQWFA